MKTQNIVSITRSFAYKLNLGNYQTADFYCEQKAEVPENEAERKSEELYCFCRKEVEKSIKKYLEVNAKEVWDEKKQELYNDFSKGEELKRELMS